MKHSDLKVGMKVKRVEIFDNDWFTTTEGNISTVSAIFDRVFFTKEDGELVWEAEYFEPVEEIKEETMANKITLDKKYRTRCGYPVRVLCVDREDELPVLFLYKSGNYEYSASADAFGKADWETTDYDLIEVSPWEDFKKDDKVMVSNYGTYWEKRYFSHVEDGIPWCYNNGNTSFTTKDTSSWLYCRKPTQEELEG